MKIRSCPSPDCVCACGRGRRVSRGRIKVFSGLYPQLPNVWQWITRASDNFNNDITRLSYQSLLLMARMRHGLLMGGFGKEREVQNGDLRLPEATLVRPGRVYHYGYYLLPCLSIYC